MMLMVVLAIHSGLVAAAATAKAATSSSQFDTTHTNTHHHHDDQDQSLQSSLSLRRRNSEQTTTRTAITEVSNANTFVPELEPIRTNNNNNDVTYLRSSTTTSHDTSSLRSLRLPSAQQQLEHIQDSGTTTGTSTNRSSNQDHELEQPEASSEQRAYSPFRSLSKQKQDNEDDNDGRIVGGTAATVGYWPHQVQILIDGNFVCGGSLIAADLVVCAAHCTLYAGEVGIKRHTNPNSGQGPPSSSSSEGEVIRIATKKNHPLYKTAGAGSSYDIALYHLEKPVSLSVYGVADFVSLNSDASVPLNDQPLTVTGWGATTQGGQASSVLQQVEVDYIPNNVCGGPDTTYMASAIHEDMMCAGHLGVGQKDACQGDSGGPLVIDGGGTGGVTSGSPQLQPPFDYNPHVLVGVVSWGSGCAQARSPGVYARISYFKEWIEAEAKSLSSQHYTDLKWVSGGTVTGPAAGPGGAPQSQSMGVGAYQEVTAQEAGYETPPNEPQPYEPVAPEAYYEMNELPAAAASATVENELQEAQAQQEAEAQQQQEAEAQQQQEAEAVAQQQLEAEAQQQQEAVAQQQLEAEAVAQQQQQEVEAVAQQQQQEVEAQQQQQEVETAIGNVPSLNLNPNACCWASTRGATVATVSTVTTQQQPRNSNRVGCLNHEEKPACSLSETNCASNACGNGQFIADLTQLQGAEPTGAPSTSPSASPSAWPSASPSVSSVPSLQPSDSPSVQPSLKDPSVTINVEIGHQYTTPEQGDDRTTTSSISSSITYTATFAMQKTFSRGCVDQETAFLGESDHARECPWVAQVSQKVIDPLKRSQKVNDRCQKFGDLCPVSCGFCVP
jgi:trypsin